MPPENKRDISAIVTPAEFSKIPLDFIIATPLLTTIEAHKVAAQTTLEFVKGLNNAKNVDFKIEVRETKADGTTESVEKNISVPLLALVKVPNLNFDSLSIGFNYNISQVYREQITGTQKAALEISTKGILSKFVNASLTGTIEHSRTRENSANRGGSMEVKVHVSESELPAGLQKIINAMVENIDINTPNAPE